MEGLVSDGSSMFFLISTPMNRWNSMNRCSEIVFGVGKLPNALLVSLFKGSWFHDTINTSNLDNYFPLFDCLSSLKLCFYGYKDACSVARPDPEKNRMDFVHLQTLQPWLRWWKAIQVRGPRQYKSEYLGICALCTPPAVCEYWHWRCV